MTNAPSKATAVRKIPKKASKGATKKATSSKAGPTTASDSKAIKAKNASVVALQGLAMPPEEHSTSVAKIASNDLGLSFDEDDDTFNARLKREADAADMKARIKTSLMEAEGSAGTDKSGLLASYLAEDMTRHAMLWVRDGEPVTGTIQEINRTHALDYTATLMGSTVVTNFKKRFAEVYDTLKQLDKYEKGDPSVPNLPQYPESK